MPPPRSFELWRDRAEIDHVGPFVKAWAAFNAWYRHASNAQTDREGIRHVCRTPNPVRSAILPFLDPLTDDTPDASAFKQHLANLHAALEAHRLETVRDGRIEHVSFRSAPIAEPKPLPQDLTHNRVIYRVCKADKRLVSTIVDRHGVEQLRIEQDVYDLGQLTGEPSYAALDPGESGRLRALYVDCNPRPMMDLLNGAEPSIRAGTITFRATCENLFAGTIHTIYRMRNMLLHGELAPDPEALAGFEHAFHLLRRMLRECR